MSFEKQGQEQSPSTSTKVFKFTERGFFKSEFVVTNYTSNSSLESTEYVVKCGYNSSKISTSSEQLIVELHKKESIKNSSHSLSFNLDYFNQSLKYVSANVNLPGCLSFNDKLVLNLKSYQNGSRQLQWRRTGFISRTFSLVDLSNPELVLAQFKRSWKFRTVGKLYLSHELDSTDLALAILCISTLIYRILVSERSSN